MFSRTRHDRYLSVKGEATPRIIASITREAGRLVIAWWVGPVGKYAIRFEAKGMVWAKRSLTKRGEGKPPAPAGRNE